MHPALGGEAVLLMSQSNECKLGAFLLQTVGSTLGSQPGEWDVESEDPSLQGLRLVICSVTALGGGMLDRWNRVPVLAHGWFTCLPKRSLFQLHGLA